MQLITMARFTQQQNMAVLEW